MADDTITLGVSISVIEEDGAFYAIFTEEDPDACAMQIGPYPSQEEAEEAAMYHLEELAKEALLEAMEL